MKLSKPERHEALFILLLCSFAALLTLVAVEAPRRILAPGAALGSGLAASCVFLAASLAASGFTWRAEVRGAGLAMGVTRRLVHALEGKYERLHPMARARLSSGMLKSLLSSDALNVTQALQQIVVNAVPAAAFALVAVPFITWRLGWLGALGVTLLFSQLAFSHLLGKGIARLDGAGRQSLDALLSVAGEWVRNMRLVRALGWSEAARARMTAHLRDYVHAGAKSHVYLCLVFGTSFSWWMVPLAGMLLAAVASGTDPDVASLFQASWLLSHLSKYTMHLPNTLARWTQARVSLERIRPFLAAEETLVRRNVGEPGEVDSATESAADTFAPVPERTRGEGDAPVAVEFEDVHVWLEGRELLSLPRLLIPLARKTVVVGPVGAGKSLFVQVLTGRLPPTKGRAWLVDAQGGRSPLDEEGTRSRLLAATALVEQEAFLSSDSVAFNVALSEGADEGDVLASLQRAEFAADLAVLPHGLATAVGEGGVSLSGGQKQRVNLARALHARRPFWVLDDPLSALDADTETRLLEMLHSHGGGFLMVTHRLAGAAAFDHVLVLEEGRVVEEGAPAALLSSPRSRFARLMGVAP